jgi:hypothetical protein
MQAVRALYTPKDGDSSSDDDVVREAIERRHSNRKARVFRQTRLRGFNSERAQKMVCVVILKYHNFLTFKKTSVRKSMNELLGIKKDDDIYHYESATAEEVNSYDAGTGDAPELQPMRLYLETKQCVTWNDELCELFLDHYEQEIDQQLTPNQRLEVEEFFENRLHQLGRKWREFHVNGENTVMAKKEARKSSDRANTRRVGVSLQPFENLLVSNSISQLYNDRMLICLENLTDPDGHRNETWYRRLRMIKHLGANGMSSDESDTGQAGQVVYNVKKKAWRSDQVNKELREIDKDRNMTNAHGGRRAGNTPRERKRLHRPNVSQRDPTLRCPENYYEPAFIATLDNRAFRELAMCKAQIM